MQDFSRRRSLPALAEVEKRVLIMRHEARRYGGFCSKAGDERAADFYAVQVMALTHVLMTISEVEGEEPEGSTDVSTPHPNDL